MVLALAGCTSGSGIPYPSLPTLPGLGGTTVSEPTLTPEQQQGAIEDLSTAQAANAAAAGAKPAAPAAQEPVEPAPLPD